MKVVNKVMILSMMRIKITPCYFLAGSKKFNSHVKQTWHFKGQNLLTCLAPRTFNIKPTRVEAG